MQKPFYLHRKFTFKIIWTKTTSNPKFCRKSLTYSGLKLWNSLPLDIRNSTNLQSFKNNYLKWWFSGGNKTHQVVL
jgi:hypothetical protein